MVAVLRAASAFQVFLETNSVMIAELVSLCTLSFVVLDE